MYESASPGWNVLGHNHSQLCLRLSLECRGFIVGAAELSG